jgi:hypothetical protein
MRGPASQARTPDLPHQRAVLVAGKPRCASVHVVRVDTVFAAAANNVVACGFPFCSPFSREMLMTGSLPAVPVNLDDAAPALSGIPPDRDVVVYCS